MSVHRFVFTSAVSLFVGLGAMSGLVRAEDSLWQTNFEAAKTQAKNEKKLLLVDFTGSDWCIWCKRLKGEVFDKETFKTEAPKKYVLVELDFPNAKKQPAELKKQNEALRDRYKLLGYPTVLLMGADGVVIARTGYQPGGPEKYMEHLAKFIVVYGDAVKMKEELATLQGLDRVKMLDKLADTYTTKLNNDGDEVLAWSKEIVALDPDNKSGLKIKYQFNIFMAEFNELKGKGKTAEARAVADEMLALSGASVEQKQGVYLALCQMYMQAAKFAEARNVAGAALAMPGISAAQKQAVYLALCQTYDAQGDFANVVASLKKGIEVAPDSVQGKQFTMLQKRYEPKVEMQENIVKLKAELKNSAGLDRAKILDKLIDANAKIGGRVMGISPKELVQWLREIIRLDSDNQAGLKQKYEFPALMADAQEQFQQKKNAEGEALIAKALALPKIKTEQVQQANFVLGMHYLQAKDFQKSIAAFKKAAAVATNPMVQAMIKNFLQQAENGLEAQKTDKTND